MTCETPFRRCPAEAINLVTNQRLDGSTFARRLCAKHTENVCHLAAQLGLALPTVEPLSESGAE